MVDKALSDLTTAYLMPILSAIPGYVKSVAPAYWTFLDRPASSVPNHTLDDGNYWSWTMFWTLLFMGNYYITPFIMNKLYPEWYESVPAKKKKEIPSWMNGIVHHLIVVPWSVQRIWADVHRTNYTSFDYSTELWAVPVLWGHLISDVICYAVPFRYYDYIIHHFVTAAFTYTGSYTTSGCVRFIPHMLVAEMSSLFFGLAFFFKIAGYKDSPLVLVLEMSFTISYFFLRTINMPMTLLVSTLNGMNSQMGMGRFSYLPLAALQWFWQYKVMMGIVDILMGKKDKEAKNCTKSESSESVDKKIK